MDDQDSEYEPLVGPVLCQEDTVGKLRHLLEHYPDHARLIFRFDGVEVDLTTVSESSLVYDDSVEDDGKPGPSPTLTLFVS